LIASPPNIAGPGAFDVGRVGQVERGLQARLVPGLLGKVDVQAGDVQRQGFQAPGLGVEHLDDALFAGGLGGVFQAGPGGVEIGHAAFLHTGAFRVRFGKSAFTRAGLPNPCRRVMKTNDVFRGESPCPVTPSPFPPCCGSHRSALTPRRAPRRP
jgi:hypothetical protein